MASTKSAVLYFAIVFYTLMSLGTALYGNSVIHTDYNSQFKLAYDDVLNKNANDDLLEKKCSIPIYTADGWQFSDLIPNFLKPKCSAVYADEIATVLVEDKEGSFQFIPALVVGVDSAPDWFNVLFFGPLVILMLFLLVTTIGGAIFDGGA